MDSKDQQQGQFSSDLGQQTEGESKRLEERLRPPAIAVLMIAVASLINILLGAVLQVATNQLTFDFSDRSFSEPINSFKLSMLVFISLLHFVYIYGACLMLQKKRHQEAVIAMKMACVPICTPCLFLGIPVAIWALSVLNDPKMKAYYIGAENQGHPTDELQADDQDPTE